MGDRLEGRVALVTGGASGLGESSVRRFAGEGAYVLVADLQREAGEALARELGERVLFQTTDVTREADVAAAVDRAVAEWGQLDCMFNNAGIVGVVGPIDEIPVERWDETLAVLLRGAFLGTKHAARVMKPRRSGVILSTSSVAGLEGGLGPHAYATAKTALIGFTRNVAAELGRFGIRVNCIAPGNMATPMAADVMSGDPDAVAEAEGQLASVSPLRGRAGLASDIADAALWLASDESGYVSGHTLVVDGGLTTGSGNRPLPLFSERAQMIRERGRRDA